MGTVIRVLAPSSGAMALLQRRLLNQWIPMWNWGSARGSLKGSRQGKLNYSTFPQQGIFVVLYIKCKRHQNKMHKQRWITIRITISFIGCTETSPYLQYQMMQSDSVPSYKNVSKERLCCTTHLFGGPLNENIYEYVQTIFVGCLKVKLLEHRKRKLEIEHIIGIFVSK